MLVELKITDFALVDELTLEFAPGLNVLTGETGAGKSIVIDAVSAILGGRVSTGTVRQGAPRAVIEAAFDVHASSRTVGILEALGHDREELLILTRDVAREGRSRCRVNARLANASQLVEIGETLVDIHGQHDHQSLLSTARHIELLDAMGGEAVSAAVGNVEALVRERTALARRVRELEEGDRHRAQKEDMLRFQIAEITAAGWQTREEEELTSERGRLVHAERIARAVQEAYHALYGGEDGSQAGAVDAAGLAVERLRGVVAFDGRLGPIVNTLEQVLDLAQDAAHELRRFSEGVEPDPGRLDTLEERLQLLAKMKRKYGDSIPDILAFAEKAQAELAELTGAQDELASLDAERARNERALAAEALELSTLRRRTGERVQEMIEQRLHRLQMPDARFEISLHRVLDDQGVNVDGERVRIGPRGIDEVEFLFSANPGEGLRPLARIASGGEMSGVMLAIKGAMAEIDPVGTLIFDEVDAGLGGRAAESVADALGELAGTHQVLVVTHLAQIAARADHHFAVEKVTEDGRTKVAVRPLTGEARVREIARMLDGQATKTGFEHARALLALADKGKTAS